MHSNEKPHRCGGCRRGRRAWPGFEIDDSEPQVHAWREPRGPRSLAVGLGGGARGRRVLDGMCTAMKSPTGVEGAGGAGGPGRASRSTTPSRRFTHGRNREARVARGAWPRCRWVPEGGGRAWPGFEIDDSEPKAHVWRSRGRAAAHRHTQPHNNQHPQRHEAVTGFPATASSRSISAAQNDGTAQKGATQQSGTVSDQAVMSTWSSTAARPASRRATGTRNGEQDT